MLCKRQTSSNSFQKFLSSHCIVVKVEEFKKKKDRKVQLAVEGVATVDEAKLVRI